MRRSAVAAAFALVALVPQFAHAALFDDEEARKRITATNVRIDQLQKDLEDRVAQLERQLKSGALVDLANNVEGLKSDVAKIRGQIEVLTYELEQSQKRQKDLYVDLDARMRKLEGSPGPSADGAPADAAASGAAAGSGAASVATSLPSTPAEQRAYDAALDQFKRGDYQGAITGFTAFVKTNPKSALAPSAQYWIGNAHFARKDYKAAIASQRQLLLAWPDSPKVPDALLNVASAQSELGDSTAARRTLEELIGKFPQSDAAAKAKQRLGQR
ncbi:MAG TPA: tol-pal system protein YbgF [Casimicrobiaceae bacterium]